MAALTAIAVVASLVAAAPGQRAVAAGSGPGDTARSAESTLVNGVDLDTVTIPELQARMDRGSLSPLKLTLAYLRRIKAVDSRINAVLRTSPTALRQAAASDLRHRLGKSKGPLDGIPVLLKE